MKYFRLPKQSKDLRHELVPRKIALIHYSQPKTNNYYNKYALTEKQNYIVHLHTQQQ